MRSAHALLWLLTLVSRLLTLESPLAGAEPLRPIRESVLLPTDSQVPKTLLTADEYLAERRYEELTDLLVQLTETHGADLVLVPQRPVSSVNRYVNVSQYCQRMLASLPPEGRAISRKRLDPQARRWFETWQTTQDEALLERIVHSAFISSFGDDALWGLAQIAWDRGDFKLADAYWRRLDPSDHTPETEGLNYPDPGFAAADVRARRILCSIFSRQFSNAERKLVRFREDLPQARGKLAGREGVLAEILADVLADAKTWKFLDATQELTTFGGSPERQRNWSWNLDVGPHRWSASWPAHDLPRLGGHFAADRGPIKSFAVIDGSNVFVSNGDAIRAWNLFSGEPAWPNDQPDRAVIYDDNPEDRRWRPDRPCAGVPWQTLTVHQGKLYARMGSPLTGAARIELHELTSRLVCLDVQSGQGRLVWTLDASDLPGEGPLWSFEGTPVVLDSTAYCVLYRRQPEPEYAVVALDANSGDPRWLRSIGAARPAVEDAVNRVTHLLLAAGEGHLFLSTDQGAIVALSPSDGRLLWAVSYESQPVEVLPGLATHLQTGLLPPLFWNGLVFVSPNDTRWLFCLEANSGRVVWQKRAPEALRHLIGVTEQGRVTRLVASGKSLFAFNVDDGSIGWKMSQSAEAASDQGYGHGLLSGESVWWPTREYLYQLDQATGGLQRKIPLHTPDAPRSGGNLAVADGLLVVVEPDRIAVYGEYSLLKERLKIELSQRPDDARLWQQLMSLESGAERWEAAETAGRRAWSFRESLPESARNELRSRYADVLHKRALEQIVAEDLADADRLYRELSELSSSTGEQGRLWWEWAHLDQQRGELAAAVSRLHAVLALFHRERFELEGRPANLAVRTELERLLQRHGRKPFREVDGRAERELAKALSAGDVDAMPRILRDYPLLSSAVEVWPNVIDEAVRRKNWPAAWSLLDEWADAAATESQRRIVEQRRIAALEAAGYLRSAKQRRLLYSADEPSTLATPSGPSWHYVSRAWQVDLLEPDRALIPAGEPPADHLACIVLSGSALRALDRRTGENRWQQPVADRPLWAAYGETNLLLATSEAITARRLETGELLWQREWNSSDGDRMRVIQYQLLAFDPKRGVIALSADTGETLWEFRPPRGSLQPYWLCNADQAAVQTLDPGEIWIVDVATGRLRRSGNGPDLPWQSSPADFGAGRFGYIATDGSIAAWSLQRNERWRYRGAMSQAHAGPVIVHDGKRMALLIDGTTLVGLDPEAGQRQWGTGLADQPLTDPTDQVAVGDGIAAAAWNSTIRAVSLTDGQILWEQRLPAESARWKAVEWRGLFAVQGMSTRRATAEHLLLLFHSDGHPIQMVTQTGSRDPGEWRMDEQGILFASPHLVSAWIPLAGDP